MLIVGNNYKVLVKKYLKEVKPTEYKSQPILTPEDFPSKELMANFYKSDSGKKINGLQNNFNTKKYEYYYINLFLYFESYCR